MGRFRRLLITALPAVLVGGCLGRTVTPPADKPSGPPLERLTGTAQEVPLDPSPRLQRRLGVRVYTVDVPRGRVSGNEALWRRIDEQTLDPAPYDVLWANGVRAGAAPLDEIEHLREVLEVAETPATDIYARGPGRQSHELPLGGEILEQTLFWFDASKRSHGRTFQRCENVLVVGFGPTPGRMRSMRLSLTPVVRSTRPRQVVTPSGDSYEIKQVRDENLFDLQLRVDVPFGDFLVVAPSEELTQETSLGRQFFTYEREGELWERVYVLIPRVIAQQSD